MPVILTGPLLPLALIAHWTFVPLHGAIAAATVTTAFASLAALLCMGAVCKIWRIPVPVATLVRSLAISCFAYGVAVYWQTPGLLVFVKIPMIILSIVFVFVLMGELNAKERNLLRDKLKIARVRR